MDIIGLSEDNKQVVDGVFKLFDSTGLPLDVIFDQCKENNMVPSWIHFYEDALRQGWKYKTIFNRLETNVSDVWGRDYYNEIKTRLDKYIGDK